MLLCIQFLVLQSFLPTILALKKTEIFEFWSSFFCVTQCTHLISVHISLHANLYCSYHYSKPVLLLSLSIKKNGVFNNEIMLPYSEKSRWSWLFIWFLKWLKLELIWNFEPEHPNARPLWIKKGLWRWNLPSPFFIFTFIHFEFHILFY